MVEFELEVELRCGGEAVGTALGLAETIAVVINAAAGSACCVEALDVTVGRFTIAAAEQSW